MPVIVVTAYDDRDFRIEALSAGATDFLRSPVDHQEFQTRVRNLLKLGCQQRMIRDRALALERELQASERRRDQWLRESRQQLAQVIDTVPAMISATDASGRCIFVNAYQTSVLGERDPEGPCCERGAELDRLVVTSGQSIPGFEEQIIDRTGESRTFITSKTSLLAADGEIMGVLTTSLDISERKQAEARLRFQAQHDHLTALPNRGYMYERLRYELESARELGRMFALHFIDLDRFKYVNDGLGHHCGDRLLQLVAERLRSATRSNDVVARLGGDEFAVLQVDADSAADAEVFADRINRLLVEPVVIDGREIATSASIGVTLFPRDGASPEELLQNADLAMYRVKAGGRNGFEFFAPEMLSNARQAIWLQGALHRALGEQDFVLHYQPLIELRSGRLVGAEALLRWPREDGSLALPADFLRVAEESSLMPQIDEWVLREACRQGRDWLDRLEVPLRLSVNVSPAQFHSSSFCALLGSVLAETGFPPALLELELTEGTLLQSSRSLSAQLELLRGRGVRLAIDDFGTGFSSLARLANLRVDRLKIDHSFVSRLEDPTNMAVVRAVISLGRTLNIEVLAEGVETEYQLRQLAQAGCDLVQGYHCGRPMGAERFERYLEDGMPALAVAV